MALGKGCLHAHVVPEKIKKWLTEEELNFVQLIGEQARNALFNILVTLPSKTKVNIVQSSHKKDSLCVSAVLIFGANQIKQLEQKSKPEIEKIFSKIQFKLAAVDAIINFGENKLTASHIIYYDGLTKDRLFHAISIIEKAYILSDLALKKAL